MIEILLALAGLRCAVGWFNNYIEKETVTWYMAKKMAEPPRIEELEACRNEVIKKIFYVK